MKGLLLVAMIVLSSCAEEEVVLNIDDIQIRTVDGIQMAFYSFADSSNSAKTVSGRVVDHYDNGQLRWESIYVDGKKTGIHRGWYDNGQLWNEDVYKQGLREGYARSWQINGSPKLELNYVNGVLDGDALGWDGLERQTKAVYSNGELQECMWVGDAPKVESLPAGFVLDPDCSLLRRFE